MKQYSLNEIKWIVSCNNLLNYLGFNETFIIHTNASAFQLGEFNRHKVKPISLYIIKLTDSQQMYKVA